MKNNDLIVFLEKTNKFPLNEIKSIKKIKRGFTNRIYKVSTRNEIYKVRLANENAFINRDLEKSIEQHLNSKDIIFYDSKGNYIKKWILGKELKNNNVDLNTFVVIQNVLNKLNNIRVNKEINIRYPIYYDEIPIENELIDAINLYKKITSEFNASSFLICHNDCSLSNIIECDNILHLIDYEWSSYNHRLWDISNLIKDLEINYDELSKYIPQDILDDQELINIIFCVHCYTYFWTRRMLESKKIIKYRQHIINRILYWYNIICKYEK